MYLEQFYLVCLAQASYLIADEGSGVAVVVDPRRDVDEYLEVAAEKDFRVEHVILTHFHADFVAGHLELRERTGATIWLGARARAEYEFSPLASGDVLTLGDSVRLEARETPGHTPEGICLLVHDRTSVTTPHAVLTGDTLFIGDVGRPDLMASIGVTAEELAGMMYDSLHGELLTLPDETLVYPGHGAGSMCGKNLSTDTVSTIGAQRETNHALQPMSKADFVAMATSGLPKAPAYFARDARINREEHATLAGSPANLPALDADEVRESVRNGATLLDVRPSDAFAIGHIAGSINIGLDGNFASWVGTLLPEDRPIVLIARKGDEAQAVLRMARVGYENVAGYMASLGDSDDTTQKIGRRGRLDPETLAAELEAENPPLLLDVRTCGEWDEGHIEGAVHIPLSELRERFDEIPRDRDVVAMCRSGYRSSTAASLMATAGFENVRDLAGGFVAWTSAGKAVV